MIANSKLHQRHEYEESTRGHPYVDSFDIRNGWQGPLRLCTLCSFIHYKDIKLLHSIPFKICNVPRVSKDVTPNVTLAGMASGLIQNEIQDMTTINPDGMYV